MTRLPRIPLLDRTASFFYTTLPYIGVRSWVAYALFEVRNGKLDRSQTGVAEYRMEGPDYTGFRHFAPLGYQVDTWRESTGLDRRCHNRDYLVDISQGDRARGSPANFFSACVLQSAGMPMKRHLMFTCAVSTAFFAAAGSTNSHHRHGPTIQRATAQAFVTRTSKLEWTRKSRLA
jgi:hypothetical protein